MKELPYKGVVFLPKSKRRPWKAQIVRKGMCHYLGTFDTPLEASQAFDNASWHTRRWAANPDSPMLNFPEDVELKRAGPLPRTEEFIRRLQNEFPKPEKVPEVIGKDTELSRLDAIIWESDREEQKATARKNRAILALIERQRALVAKLIGAQKEIDTLKRVIEGMRAAGGAKIFNPVGSSNKVPGSVDSHLS